jgi:hypothetical protein
MPSSVIFVFQGTLEVASTLFTMSIYSLIDTDLHTTLIFDVVAFLIMCVINFSIGQKIYNQTI